MMWVGIAVVLFIVVSVAMPYNEPLGRGWDWDGEE